MSVNLEKNENKHGEKKSLKIFFIKLISTAVAVIIVINVIFNLIFAERLKILDQLLLLERSDVRAEMKEKIRNELNESLNKENLIYEKDKILLYKLYKKLKIWTTPPPHASLPEISDLWSGKHRITSSDNPWTLEMHGNHFS